MRDFPPPSIAHPHKEAFQNWMKILLSFNSPLNDVHIYPKDSKCPHHAYMVSVEHAKTTSLLKSVF